MLYILHMCTCDRKPTSGTDCTLKKNAKNDSITRYNKISALIFCCVFG